MEINYLAVLVAAVLNMIVGYVWYGPLFGSRWTRLMGWTKADMEAGKDQMGKTYGLTYVGAALMAYVLAVVLNNSNATDYVSGAMVGFWVWLGFVLPVLLNEVLFGRKSWDLYYLNIGYYLVTLLLMGAVLAGWGFSY
jgi:hypothetical protein